MRVTTQKITGAALMALGLAASTAVMAEDPPYSISANVGLTSDYVFRGVSQTQSGPAIQGGIDFSHEIGFYVGTWASNVNWVEEGGYMDNNSMEMDFYGGFRGSFAEDFGYDLGVIHYFYPGDDLPEATDPDTTEVYVGLSWKTLALKYSHVVSDHFVGWTTPEPDYGDTRGSYYIELNGSYDLIAGISVLGHIGYQDVKDNDDASYTDWKLGVSKDFGFGVVTLAYTDTDADEDAYTWDGEGVADGRAIISFLKTF